jgi:bifunctional DNase/RNase
MKKNDNKIIASIIIGMLTFFLIYLVNLTVQLPQGTPTLSDEGFVKVNVQLDGAALKFYSDCFSVTMNIHELQALSIRTGLENRINVRPLTHDMFRETMDNFGIKTIKVRIETFEDDIYKARTFLKQGNKILDIDTRPSDAVGIAVRTNAPVYFNQQLLESKGENTCK